MPERAVSSLTFTQDDYPALYLAADQASRSAQQGYATMTAVILGGLVGSAALSALSRVFPNTATVFAFLTAALTALSFLLTTMRRALKPEKKWYAGRAVAEAVKSLTWRFMTCAEPYPLALPTDAASNKFLADLRSTVEDQGRPALGFGSEFSDHPQITSRMREARAAPLEMRRDLYVAARIQDQRKWYSATARRNQTKANRFYIVIQVSQAIALASSALLLSPQRSMWDFAGIFAALASALLAWLQLRQYEELVQSYAMAALDLGLVEERAKSVETEADLSAFIADAEATVSREHGLWMARRG